MSSPCFIVLIVISVYRVNGQRNYDMAHSVSHIRNKHIFDYLNPMFRLTVSVLCQLKDSERRS